MGERALSDQHFWLAMLALDDPHPTPGPRPCLCCFLVCLFPSEAQVQGWVLRSHPWPPALVWAPYNTGWWLSGPHPPPLWRVLSWLPFTCLDDWVRSQHLWHGFRFDSNLAGQKDSDPLLGVSFMELCSEGLIHMSLGLGLNDLSWRSHRRPGCWWRLYFRGFCTALAISL